MLANKTLMITGGTGSFGGAVLQRFLQTDIGEIRIFSRDEKKQEDLRLRLQNPKVKFYIGDVRDVQSLLPTMTGVDYVFHAAALKQVPSCEFYPLEAVKTNVLGTENVLNAALMCDVKKVVVLSTDKAVYPINAMGISKAMMEKVMVARSRTVAEGKTVMCGTRYGNVMASRGSVIPLFLQQILSKQPLTVTDPDMTRFLMSLEDAVDLVLYAFKNGVAGDIFVQKAPASTIGDLALAMCNIFGVPRNIKVIGTRHGEKLYETLLTREELASSKDLGAYYRVAADNRDLNYEKYFTQGEQKVSVEQDYNSHNTERLGPEKLKATLLALPEYKKRSSNGGVLMLKVMTVVGTRPELIKLSQVIEELDNSVEHCLVHTGQNFDFELNEIFFKELGIRAPNHFLDCARPTAAETIARVIERVDALLVSEKPDAVLIYGDTNSCLAALVAKRRQVPIFHMEAGNRCFDMRVPEEINRRVVDHLSDINMTLTEHARRYLLNEGIRGETVMCVGSSMPEVLARHRKGIDNSKVLSTLKLKANSYFVVSAHREENVDDPAQFDQLLRTLRQLSTEFSLPIIFSTHPRTQKKLTAAGIEAIPGVHFLKPLGFFDYIALQKSAFCVLSDSGTITEEASILKFPAVTIRNAHERPEGMDAGILIMSGLRADRVVDAVKVVVRQNRDGYKPADVEDYMAERVSIKVVRIILSYVDYIRRTTWFKPAEM